MSRGSSKTRPNSILLILFAAAAAITCAYALLPDDRTRAAVALRDGRLAEAVQLFQSTVESGGDPNALITLYRLHAHFGDRDKAGMVLRRFVDEYPREIWALRELVTHYKHSHDETHYLSALTELIRKAPNKQSYAELMGHYRLNGDVENEMALFPEGQKLGLVSDRDVARAGLIIASQGRLADAADLIQSVELSRDPMRESIQLNLFHILVDLSRFDEAFKLALKIQTIKNDWRTLALAFERVGRVDYADRLRRAALAQQDAKRF